MDNDNKARNHAQAQKASTLVSDEDVCNRSDKLSNPPSLILLPFCDNFHTLPIPSQELIFPMKPVA